MNNDGLPPKKILASDFKDFRRVHKYSFQKLSGLLEISIDTLQKIEDGDEEISTNIQKSFWKIMKNCNYLPDLFLDSFRDSLVESYRIKSIDDWNSFNEIYVDPTEFRDAAGDKTTFFNDILKKENSIIIGQRGTGKSTLFAGLISYIYDSNKQPRNNDKSLAVYIDARAFDTSLSNMPLMDDGYSEDSDISQAILKVLAIAISKDIPNRYHEVKKGLFGFLCKAVGLNCNELNIIDRDNLKNDLYDLIDKGIVDQFGIPVVSNNTEGVSITDLTSSKMKSPGSDFNEKNYLEWKKKYKTRPVLFTESVLEDYKKFLKEKKYNRVYLCIDDFSLISEVNRDKIWNIIKKQYFSSDFLIFKITTYPGTIYGFDDPNFEDATPLYVDQFRHRDWLEQDFKSEDEVGAKHILKIITKRLAVNGITWAQVFSAKEKTDEVDQLCHELYYSSSGLTRNAGMVLKKVKEGLGKNLTDKISAAQLWSGGRRFYDSELHRRLPKRMFFMENEDKKIKIAELYQKLLDDLVSEFKGIEGYKLPTSSYFNSSFAVSREKTEDILQPLAHIGYIMKRFECGDVAEKYGEKNFYKKYSVYSLNYGLVQRSNLKWDTQDNLKIKKIKFHQSKFLSDCKKTNDIILNDFCENLLLDL